MFGSSMRSSTTGIPLSISTRDRKVQIIQRCSAKLSLAIRLTGFYRLRSGRIRVICQERTVSGERQICCFHADYRASVYDVFEQLLTADLIEQFSD